MKKLLLVIGVCALLICMQSMTAMSLPRLKNPKAEMLQFEKNGAGEENAPSWAEGNFTGVWGLNVWGSDWFALGCVEGYYGKGFLWNFKFGRFLITYKEDGCENGTNYEGLFFGPYLLGVTTEMESGNETAFVGIGSYNETSFRWRLMGMNGPTLFMKGTFSKFE